MLALCFRRFQHPREQLASARLGWHRSLSAALLGLMLASLVATPAEARPSTMRLFPKETLLFVRVANAHELAERFQDTSTGRMLRDPQMQPLVDRLYGETGRLYTDQAEKMLGITWEELQQLPQGEVAFGIIGRRNARPAFLLVIDQGDGPTSAKQLLDRVLTYAQQQGTNLTTETIAGQEVSVFGGEEQKIGLFELENTIVASTDPDLLRGVLWHWRGEATPGVGATAPATSIDDAAADDADSADLDEAQAQPFVPGETLAENAKFSAILRHCRRPQDPPPHLILFADPIGLVRGFGHGNTGVRVALASLGTYGVDGLLGIGGTLTLAAGPYDDLAHLHILIENPRVGVMKLFAFEQGDTTPEPFVHHSAESYSTGHWNFAASYDRLRTMVDEIFGEGWLEARITDTASSRLGIDVPEEVIGNLAGRVSWISGYSKPAHLQSQQRILAAELIDEEAAKETLDEVLRNFNELFEERRFGTVTYYAMLSERLRDTPEEERPIDPFVAIMDGYFFIGGSCQIFERMIAARDGTIERLSETEDYARVMATLGRETAGVQRAGFMITRFEETLRHWYDLLTSPKSREFLEEGAADNSIFAALVTALDEKELPQFEVVSRYYGPNGSILYETENGFHGVSFSLRSAASP